MSERELHGFEHMLVAVDFSPSGARLHEQLSRLRVLGCRRLTLAHVIASSYGRVPDPGGRDHYRRKLEVLAESLRGVDIEVATEVGVGPVAGELLRVARGHGAGVILAGSHGHSTLRDLFLGSTVLDLLRHADLPILLAPTDPSVMLPTTALCRPLLATDGSSAAGAAEETFLTLLSHCHRGVVVSVGQWDDRLEYDSQRAAIESHIEGLAQRAPEPGFDAVILGQGKPSEAISRVASERDVDLIIVGKRGGNPVTDLLLGSTAEAVCRHARRLVLIVPG